jgi:hypothetical protein
MRSFQNPRSVQKDAREKAKAVKDMRETVMTDEQATTVKEPSKGTFDFPTLFVGKVKGKRATATRLFASRFPLGGDAGTNTPLTEGTTEGLSVKIAVSR